MCTKWPVFAVKSQRCTQTQGSALCPLQVAPATTPINGKAGLAAHMGGERTLCALLLLLPVTALVTLVAPLCFLPRDPTTTSGAIVPHPTQPHAPASSLFTPMYTHITLMNLRTRWAGSKRIPSLQTRDWEDCARLLLQH